MSSNSLQFKDLNSYVAEHIDNIFIVNGFDNAGTFDSCCTKYTNISDVLLYIRTRYLDQNDTIISRSIKIVNFNDSYVYVLQTTVRKTLTSYKHYYIHNSDDLEIEKFIESFRNSKFK